MTGACVGNTQFTYILMCAQQNSSTLSIALCLRICFEHSNMYVNGLRPIRNKKIKYSRAYILKRLNYVFII